MLPERKKQPLDFYASLTFPPQPLPAVLSPLNNPSSGQLPHGCQHWQLGRQAALEQLEGMLATEGQARQASCEALWSRTADLSAVQSSPPKLADTCAIPQLLRFHVPIAMETVPKPPVLSSPNEPAARHNDTTAQRHNDTTTHTATHHTTTQRHNDTHTHTTTQRTTAAMLTRSWSVMVDHADSPFEADSTAPMAVLGPSLFTCRRAASWSKPCMAAAHNNCERAKQAHHAPHAPHAHHHTGASKQRRHTSAGS